MSYWENINTIEKQQIKKDVKCVLRSLRSPIFVHPNIYDALAELGLVEERNKNPINPKIAKELTDMIEKYLFVI